MSPHITDAGCRGVSLVFGLVYFGKGGEGTREEDAAAWAGEVVGLGGLADAGDGFEGVVQDEDLDEAGKGRGDDLGHEHGARRDLHVVAELEVRDEGEGLGHGDVAKGFEAAAGLLAGFEICERGDVVLHHQP